MAVCRLTSIVVKARQMEVRITTGATSPVQTAFSGAVELDNDESCAEAAEQKQGSTI